MTKRSSKRSLKMKGGAELSENDKIAEGIIRTIVNTPNLISKCPIHKDTFGNLFESQAKCDLFFVNMLGKVQLMTLLMDKLPKDVAKNISQNDISKIESMINGIEVAPEVAAKFGPVLTVVIDKLYSVDNLFRLASSNKEVNQQLTKYKDSLELVTQHIKKILMVYFGVTPSSGEFKNLVKEFITLVKFIHAINNDSNNININLKESLQKIGMFRLVNIVYQTINKPQKGGMPDIWTESSWRYLTEEEKTEREINKVASAGVPSVSGVLGVVILGPIMLALCLGLFFVCIPAILK
jgi:hypothetical protein